MEVRPRTMEVDEAERKREIMERSPFAAERKRRRELSEQGFSFAEASAKIVEEAKLAEEAAPNDVPDGDASELPSDEEIPLKHRRRRPHAA